MPKSIVLSSAVRANLLSLQTTAQLMGTTQNRLATGRKVNTALDNPTNFFTSASLQSRAKDFGALLDNMSLGVKTLDAASTGLDSITNLLETMQSTLRQARQDQSFKTGTYDVDTATIGTSATKNLTLSGSTLAAPVNIALNTPDTTPATSGKFTATNNFAATTITDAADSIAFNIAVDGGLATTVTIDQAAVQAVGNGDTTIDSTTEFGQILAAAGVTGVTVSSVGGKLTITSNSTGATSSVAISGYVKTDIDADTVDATSINAGASTAGTAGSGDGSVKNVDQLVAIINANAQLAGKVKAANDNGKLRIDNLSTLDLSVTGVNGTSGKLDGSTGTSNTVTIGGNTVRKNLALQFNQLRNEIDKTAGDSSFNGINLLKGDQLKLNFNETGTSTIVIQARDQNGNPTEVSAIALGVPLAVSTDLDTDTAIDGLLTKLSNALNSVRSQASNFGANLAIVENRTDFTKSMINTLNTGADDLILADPNEEAANMLALQTRQQLSTTALSLSSQADQAVLRLFG